MYLSVKERELLYRKRISVFKTKNSGLGKNKIVQHFSSEGYATRTIYNALQRRNATSSFMDKKRTGRPFRWTTRRKSKLKRLTNNRKDVSQRKLASKFKVNVSTISRQLSKMQIKYRKREKAPKNTSHQQKKARIRCRKLYNQLKPTSKSIIIDDEKYFTWGSGYYTNDKDTCPDDVRFAGKTKFPKKVLVWLAISDRSSHTPIWSRSDQ